MQWEYAEVTASTLSINSFVLELNALGSLGWEVVAITAVDPTLGVNRLTAILKRQTFDWPRPPAEAAAWHPDPTARFAKRHWDGLRWTQHVIDQSGQPNTDFPNRR